MLPSSDDCRPAGGVPPRLSPRSNLHAGSGRPLFAILLSLCLALFLADGVVSVADDSLICFAGRHSLSALRGLVSGFALLMAAGIYGLIGLTPMVPKRLFLPIPVFALLTLLGMFPAAIYWFGRLQQIAWGLSVGQVLVALGILCWSAGGFKIRWPLVPVDKLGARGFSWLNLSVFLLVNLFVLLPAVAVYVFLCAALAVNHFSDGFMALRSGGFTVQVRTYVRDDGKTIELIPMSHVADAGYYRKLSQSFPTNSIILMEGVTDRHNLLTNRVNYARMAQTLHLAQQQQVFAPARGRMVPADVDVDQFSPDTIRILNLVLLVHAKGLTPENLQKLMQFSTSNRVEQAFMEDLLTKRNRHLLEEIHSHLSQTDHVMVPWGVAHMPGIAMEIQKAGFRLDHAQEFMVIQFRRGGDPGGEMAHDGNSDATP